VHAGQEDHARPGWTGLPVEEINGESTSMLRPTLGLRTAKEKEEQKYH